MVRTPYRKALGPGAKQPYPTVTYWKASEGLVFVGSLLTAPRYPQDCFLSPLLPLCGLAIQALAGAIDRTRKRSGALKSKGLQSPGLQRVPPLSPFHIFHFQVAKTSCLK